MDFVLGIMLGAFIGTAFGVIITSLMSVSDNDDVRRKR